MFDINPGLPDQRRKKLLQKLSGQMGRPGVPMPGNEGRPFQSVGAGRLPRSHATGPSNVLASVMARLGALGGPGNAHEISPGNGMAIPGPSRLGPPAPPFAPPIPVPGAPPIQPLTPAPGSSGPGIPADGGLPAGGDGYGVTPGGAPADTPSQSVTQQGIAGNFGGQQPNIVPLGGGMYYDPVSDSVIGGGTGAGLATRRL